MSRVPDATFTVEPSGEVIGWNSMPHYTYVIYSRSGAVLYVGLAVNPWTRLKGHRRDAAWFARRAYRVECFRHPDRTTAAADERALIRELRPRFNTVGVHFEEVA